MKQSICILALASALAVVPTHALFSNGGFEDPVEGLTNWNLRYGTCCTSGDSGSASVNWGFVQGDQPSARIVIPTTIPGDPTPGAFHDIFVDAFNYPYEGIRKSLLNYHTWLWYPGPDSIPAGSNHATQISQEAVVTAADVGPGGVYNLYVSWGAVMDNPSHGVGDPFVEVMLIVNGDTVAKELHYSNDITDVEWYNTDHYPPGYDNLYYTNQVFMHTGLAIGDVVKVIVTIADCAYGGHGAYAWLDYAGSVQPQEPPIPGGIPCIIARDALRLGDYARVNGNMLSGGSGELGAYVVGEQNFKVKGPSFLRSFSRVLQNYTYETTSTLQAGASVLGTTTQVVVPVPVMTPHVLVPGALNVEVPNDGSLTLAPGAYGDVVVRARSTIFLSPGVYTFNNLNVEPGSTVNIANATAQTTIEVESNLDVYSGALLQVADSSKLNWYTNDLRVELHSGLNMVGSIFAPRGQVVLQPRSTLKGSIRALDILIEANSQVTCVVPDRVSSSLAPSSSSSDTTSSSSVAPSSSSSIGRSSSNSIPVSSSSGGFVCTGDCLNAEPFEYWAALNTLGEKWFVTTGPITGWTASEVGDRVITVNGVVMTVGQVPLAAAADGKVYFHFSPGAYSWASVNVWR